MLTDSNQYEQARLTVSKLKLFLVVGDKTVCGDLSEMTYIVFSSLSNVFLFNFKTKMPSFRMQSTKRYF